MDDSAVGEDGESPNKTLVTRENLLAVLTNCISYAQGLLLRAEDDSAVREDRKSPYRIFVTEENFLAVSTTCVPYAHGTNIRAGDHSAVGEDGESRDNTLVAYHGHLEAVWRLQRTFLKFQP